MKIEQFVLIATAVGSLLCFGPEAVAANVALSGTASQSSIDLGGGSTGFAYKGIDGNRNGDYYGGGSVTHTYYGDPDPAPDLFEWWEVKLDRQYPIDQIKIFNRTDCCSERLIPFRLTVFDGATPVFSQDVTAFVADITGLNISGMTFNLSGQVGDRVRVQLLHQDFLSLAEVEVIEGQSNDEFTINLTTFIPGNSLEGPPNFRCGTRNPGGRMFGLVFAGDNRTFDPTSSDYRTRQNVTVIPDESVDSDGLKDGSIQNLTGITEAYAGDALPTIDAADDDYPDLHDCHLLHDIGQADNGNMHVNVSRIGPHEVSVNLSGGASNPLVTNAPDIDWDFTLIIDSSSQIVRWTLDGLDDGFPAFEIYINNTPIYTRNAPPPYTFRDISKLYPGNGDVTVSLSGDLP